MQSSLILRTGEEVPTPLVGAVMLALETLVKKNPIALYELVQISRNPKHKLFGNTGDILRDLALIETNGQPCDATRLIVLAATEGEGLALKLVQPIHKEYEEQAKSQRAFSKIRSLCDAEFYQLTRKVADIIFTLIEAETSDPNGYRSNMEDRRNERANPFYNQTADGLFLELYYGMPSSLWTPWGKWDFGGSGGGCWNTLLPLILERFGATLHQPLRRSSMGEFGPVYALHKVSDTPLPNPIELDNAAYASYEDSRAAWEELTLQYRHNKASM